MLFKDTPEQKNLMRFFLWGAVGIAAIGFLFLCFFPLKGFDTWWLLSSGREMVQSRSFLTRDIFTCAIYGKPWMNKYMPFEILAYSIFAVAGYNGLIALRCVLACLALFLGFVPAFVWRKQGSFSRIPLFGVALLIPFIGMILSRRMIIRPELFSLVFFTGFVCLWEMNRNRALRIRFWVAALILQLVWTNFHSGFFMAFPTAVFYILERGVRNKNLASREWLVLPALVLISFFNPYGYHLHKEIIEVMSAPQYGKFIVEWRPLFRQDYPLFHKVVIMGFVLAAISGFILNARNVRFAHVGLLCLLILMTLLSRRHAVFLCLFSPAVILWNYAHWHESRGAKVPWGRIRERVNIGMLWIFLLFFNFMIASGALYKRHILNGPFGFGIDDSLYPRASADFMESAGVQGNILTRYGYGGYLIWRLTPRVRPCVDGRAEPFPIRLLERYWDIYTGEESPEDFCREFDVTIALIDYEDEPLLKHFKEQKAWGLCYLGYREALFLKRTAGNKPILEAFEIPLSLSSSEEVRKRLRLPSPAELAAYSPYLDYRRIVGIRVYLLKTLGIIDSGIMKDQDVLSLMFGEKNPGE